VTPGVYPKAAAQYSSGNDDEFPTVNEHRRSSSSSHHHQNAAPSSQQKQSRKASMSEFRQRRVMSEDHANNLQKANSLMETQSSAVQHINPLQSRLIRVSNCTPPLPPYFSSIFLYLSLNSLLDTLSFGGVYPYKLVISLDKKSLIFFKKNKKVSFIK
jgi:hypothetical protein